jgi:hypothetical protein
LAALGLAACGNGTTPSAPAPPPSVSPRTVTNLNISGYPPLLRVGGSAVLTATATFSDGSSREVPAVWSTSSPGVAYITADPATGRWNLLHGVAAGDVDVSATWTPASTSVRIAVREPGSLPEISGVVHEAGARASLILPDARVEISGGPHDGMSVVTDERGRFDFPDVSDAGVDLISSRRGYQSTRFRVVRIPPGGFDIAMPAVSRIVERIFSGTLAPDCIGTDAKRSQRLAPGHDGVLLISDARVSAFESSVLMYRDSTGLVSHAVEGGRAFDVDAGAEYELRVGAYCGPADTGSFQVRFTMPE